MCTGLEIALVAGTALSAGGALMQASAQSDMANYQREQAAADAQTAASQAQVEARRIRAAGDRQRAEARASLAASGVTVGVGTAEQIDQTVNARAEEDALLAIYGGKVKGQQIQTAGNLAGAQSDNAATASIINAGTSVLSGYGAMARGWKTPATKGGM